MRWDHEILAKMSQNWCLILKVHKSLKDNAKATLCILFRSILNALLHNASPANDCESENAKLHDATFDLAYLSYQQVISYCG